MKVKLIKKAIAMFSLVAVSVCTFGLNVAAAPVQMGTVLQTGSGDDIPPIIKAKWEMKRAIEFTRSVDNSPVTNMADFTTDLDDAEWTPLTQISPTGVYQDDVPYTICAIVTDNYTNSEKNEFLAGVWVSEIHYPDDRAFHTDTVTDYNGKPIPADLRNGGTNTYPDFGKSGCGDLVNDSELRLQQLTLADGIELFCNNVVNYGGDNLTSYYNGYDATEICGHELPQEDAYVYCAPSTLWYEDPAGDYTIKVKAQNIPTNAPKDFEENELTYLEMQAWDLDFDAIDYGPIGNLGQWYTEGGDKTFTVGGDGAPTVRNLGNVRLYVGIEQDDMGFNPQPGDNNIHYRARVGHGVSNPAPGWSDYRNYDPNWGGSIVWLQDILDLSEDEKIDFGVKLDQWLCSQGTGQIILSHKKANFRQCVD